MNEKHATPMGCRIRRLFTSPSPSAVAWCYMGLKRRTHKCKGCENNAGEQIHEAFLKGMEAGQALLEKLKQEGHPLVLRINGVDIPHLDATDNTKGEEETTQ